MCECSEWVSAGCKEHGISSGYGEVSQHHSPTQERAVNVTEWRQTHYREPYIDIIHGKLWTTDQPSYDIGKKPKRKVWERYYMINHG